MNASAPVIGIFFNRYPKNGPSKQEGYLYNDHPQWRSYPTELIEEFQNMGIKAVLLCHELTYLGDNTFSEYWVPSDKEKGLFQKIIEPITIDVIFDKGYFRKPASLSIVNVPQLAKLGRDKIGQYKLLSNYQPLTHVVSSQTQLVEKLRLFSGDMVVLKPNNLNGGRGVVIASPKEIEKLTLDFSGDGYIMQEFVDSSAGVEGLVDGIHDLRLYRIDNETVLSSIRTPVKGSLVANTNQGGTIDFFSTPEIPREPLQIADEVDNYFKKYGNRYYSIDLVKGAEKWYVLEINDRPGVPARFQSAEVGNFQHQLAMCIVRAANNPLNKLEGLL